MINNNFLENVCTLIDSNVTDFLLGSNSQLFIIGWSDGKAPIKRQPITWTNADLDPWRH